MHKVRLDGPGFGIAVVVMLAAACGTGGSDGVTQPPQAFATAGASPGAPQPTAPSAPAGTAGTGAASPPTASVGISAGGAAPAGVSAGSPAPAGEAPPSAGTQDMPCTVVQAVAANCQKCHGESPTFGAPMPLVTVEDFHRPSRTQPGKKVYELSLERMNDVARPMPPASAISQEEKRTLVDWLSGGAQPDATAQGECAASTPVRDESYYKNGLTPRDGETCYELRAHGGQTASDTSPYLVAPGEHYEQFYFAVPWGPDEVMTRFGAKYDNLKVLHHWLLFTSNRPSSDVGTHETTVGSTIGEDSQLIGGWAVGGDHVEFPADVGLELTTAGILNAQWHYYNQGDTAEPDASSIQICTVPKSMRANIGSLTFLGTEFFNGPFGMPARTESKFGGTCVNDSGAPVTIFGFTPHMHKLGLNMHAAIRRKNGMLETVFDEPFDFESQITYILPKPIVLEPGESIVSTCTFFNSTDAPVAFGPSSDQEMCYNFTLAYPARALDNGVPSLIGATNVCW